MRINYAAGLLEDVSCPLGCSSGDEMVLVGRDLLHGLPGEYAVVRCLACGLMRTNPRPTPEAIGFYYPDDYGPYVSTRVTHETNRSVSWIRKIAGLVYILPLKFNTEILPPVPAGRLLEIGCASGAFLHRMSAAGWDVEGVEFSAKAAKSAQQLGYNVYAGALEAAPTPSQPYDLIVGWMVLEHLHEPIKSLVKLSSWAQPGAWLVLSVPNAGSLEFRLLKKRWYALQLPNHLYHFTPETIRRVIDATGWKIEKIYHQRILNNLIASIGYVLKDWGLHRFGKKLIEFPKNAEKLSVFIFPLGWLLSIFGQTGRMTIWARKVPMV